MIVNLLLMMDRNSFKGDTHQLSNYKMRLDRSEVDTSSVCYLV